MKKFKRKSRERQLMGDIVRMLRTCSVTDLWALRQFVSAYTKQEV